MCVSTVSNNLEVGVVVLCHSISPLLHLMNVGMEQNFNICE